MDEAADRMDHAPWPLRSLILAALGAVSGFLFHHLTSGGESDSNAALVTLVAVFGAAFAFSLERLRWQWSAIFAAGGALIAAFVAWWNGNPGGWGADEGWQFAAALAAVAIAVPLFQAARDEGRLRFVPAAVHAHAWTNIILWGAACAFVGVTMLLTFLLSELFGLIGVHFLRDLLRDGWFAPTLACAAFGGAVGLLRDRDVVTSVLQRVGRTILSVLAPVLAAGLVFFVLALPFTGLGALWEQTKETTPIVLACMFGALILTNAVAGNSVGEEARAPVLRWSAMALAATMVPLAAVAALSTGQRIAQHGFTPDRLWAAVFVAIAAAVAIGYAWALFRGRFAWPAPLRETNIRLAAGVCLLALFLALPIVNFGALSARDQVARLESGRISPAKFDWAALRFDFGPAGRKVLHRLVRSRSADIRTRAGDALAAKARWDLASHDPDRIAQRNQPSEIKVLPNAAAVPPELRALLFHDGGSSAPCLGSGECLLFWQPGETSAVAMLDGCAASVVSPSRQTDKSGCRIIVNPVGLREGRWQVLESSIEAEHRASAQEERESLRRERAAIDAGQVTIREVTRRQVFVGDEPVSQLFE
jgi:hypothetical protein